MKIPLRLLTGIILVFSFSLSSAQDGDTTVDVSGKLKSLNKISTSLSNKLDKQTDNYIKKLQKQEKKLYKKLFKKDSLLAKQLFANSDQQYAILKDGPSGILKSSQVYSAKLDSLTTSLKFIKNFSNGKGTEAINEQLKQYTLLQEKLNHSETLKKFIASRQKLLKTEFEKLGLVKELKSFQKEAFYYAAHLREWKKNLADPAKIEQALLQLALKQPGFKDFFAGNSQLGSMFALPSSNGTNGTALQGLQTRTSVNQLIVQRFGSSAAVTEQLRRNIQEGQGQLNALKSKLNGLSSGSYGNGEADLPQGFKPNNQKTKSFFQRIVVGTNIQTQRARYFFPVTSEIGLSLGYKLNDKSIIGIGASYKLGLGLGWNKLEITHQGVGLRSFVDYTIKGSFFISGGYEQNYRSIISSIDQLKDISNWQTSGLLGIGKKYKVSKKVKGEMKLLWDFMSYQQVPRAQALVFRVGYNLK